MQIIFTILIQIFNLYGSIDRMIILILLTHRYLLTLLQMDHICNTQLDTSDL